MAVNTLKYGTLFQKNLDLLAVQESVTGWMDANAGQVIYSGGAEVKIPKMTVDGLGDYDRDKGYAQGGVTLDYETRKMTQDRGRKFQLDAMDIDETNFVATAASVMGEFQRTQVVPEIDAYRLSVIAAQAVENDKGIEYGYTPLDTDIIRKIKAGIQYIRDNGYTEQLILHATGDVVMQVELAMLNHIRSVDFTKGGIKTKVPAIDDVPIISTPANRMYTAITIYDGVTAGQTKGGYKKGDAAKDVNFLIMPMGAPIAVTKQDKMKIFTPDENQDADAWKMNYRRYHDLWILDNKQNFIYANIKDEKSTAAG